MPKEQTVGKPATRRYSLEEKAAAARMVRTLRAELGTEHGTVRRHLLGRRFHPRPGPPRHARTRGRMWGLTQELFDGSAKPGTEAPPQVKTVIQAAMLAQMAERYPNIVTIATSTPHDPDSVVGHGCNDQFEFEFALDLLLDGFDRFHEMEWTSARNVHGTARS